MTQPDDTTTMVQALVANAQRLGLMWSLQFGVVVDGDDPQSVKLAMDGDDPDTQMPTISLIGPIYAGARVAVVTIPPAGQYVTSIIGSGVWPFRHYAYNAAGTAGTTVSATYVNMPGNPGFTIPKRFNAATTSLVVWFSTSLQSTLANTSVRFAINFSGVGDGDIVNYVMNPASTHLTATGFAVFPGIPAGAITITGRWRRVAGGGTLTLATDDWVSIVAVETFIVA